MLDRHVIRDFTHQEYSYQDFLKQIEKYNNMGCKVYIGTDSQAFSKHVSMVTSICFHDPGHGGKIFFIKEKLDLKEFPSLRSRMLFEAYRSIEVAMDLDPYVPGDLEIHLEISRNIRV